MIKETGGQLDRPPSSALGGDLRCFLAALGVDLLMVHDPGGTSEAMPYGDPKPADPSRRFLPVPR
jgi:hypothetical protein